MRVSLLIDCSSSILATPHPNVIAQTVAHVHLKDDPGVSPTAFTVSDEARLGCMNNALMAQLDVPPEPLRSILTTRQLYGWLVCLAISEAVGLTINLTSPKLGDPDPRD